MMHFDEWWNSAAADSFRAKHEDQDGEVFRPVWDAALLSLAATPALPATEDSSAGDLAEVQAEPVAWPKGVAQFTKKPVTINAIQRDGKNLYEVISFTQGPPDTRSERAQMAWHDYASLVDRDGLQIHTLEGKMLANVGDWIIRGVKGEHYPCKPDIFAATYEPAAAAQAEVQAEPVANCYSDDDGDTWRDCPDDSDFVEGRQLGEEFELQASIRSWSETFRVTKVPDETSDDYEVEPVSVRTAPQNQPADALDAYLQEDDQHLLYRFIETAEDDESFDIGKESVKRLANLGVVENCGFGRYGVTMFGYWVHEHFWHQKPSLPLKTNADRDKERRAAMAAAQEGGKA